MKPFYKYLLYLSLLLTTSSLYAQEQLQKVIVIDTLEYEQKYKDYRNQHDELMYGSGNVISMYCKDFFYDCVDDVYVEYESRLDTNGGERIVATVNKIPGLDYFSISVRFDDKESSLKLLNIDKVEEDTIHISRWKVYLNRVVDTTYGGRVYSKKENDSIVSLGYKVERIFKYDDFKADTLKQIQVCINDIEYVLPLTVQKEDVGFTSFSGRQEPYRVYKKYMKYLDRHNGEEPKKKKFKYDVIWGEYSTTKYIYTATIDFAATAP